MNKTVALNFYQKYVRPTDNKQVFWVLFSLVLGLVATMLLAYRLIPLVILPVIVLVSMVTAAWALLQATNFKKRSVTKDNKTDLTEEMSISNHDRYFGWWFVGHNFLFVSVSGLLAFICLYIWESTTSVLLLSAGVLSCAVYAVIGIIWKPSREPKPGRLARGWFSSIPNGIHSWFERAGATTFMCYRIDAVDAHADSETDRLIKHFLSFYYKPEDRIKRRELFTYKVSFKEEVINRVIGFLPIFISAVFLYAFLIALSIGQPQYDGGVPPISVGTIEPGVGISQTTSEASPEIPEQANEDTSTPAGTGEAPSPTEGSGQQAENEANADTNGTGPGSDPGIDPTTEQPDSSGTGTSPNNPEQANEANSSSAGTGEAPSPTEGSGQQPESENSGNDVETPNGLFKGETIHPVWGEQPEQPRKDRLALVERSFIYVGVFGPAYGAIDPAVGQSLVEQTYRRARQLEIPRLIYLWTGETAESSAIQTDVRYLVLKQDLEEEEFFFQFATPQQLMTRFSMDLNQLFADKMIHKRVMPEKEGQYNVNIYGSQGVTIGDNAKVKQNFVSTKENLPKHLDIAGDVSIGKLKPDEKLKLGGQEYIVQATISTENGSSAFVANYKVWQHTVRRNWLPRLLSLPEPSLRSPSR
ncbi:MAG: hypothetical protein H6659_19505 [Ardenticatenaceae bacterium]|nr:hypothetical protein [Ardenticatenaceae bacterium]